MHVLDLDTFRATPLSREPFDHIVVPGFVRPEALAASNAAFPAICDGGSYPLDALHYGAGFRSLIEALESAEFRSAFEEKFTVPLENHPHTITVRGQCRTNDGNIHTDSLSKIISILIYLNPAWDQTGGRLRLLRSGTDIENMAVEVPPFGGALVAFRRCDHSWHGHLPAAGERRVVQFNWVTSQRSQQWVLLRHRLSARLKRAKALFGNGSRTAPPEEPTYI